MKIARKVHAILIAALMAITLAAAAGTAWADSTGVSWEAPTPPVDPVVDPIGISWE